MTKTFYEWGNPNNETIVLFHGMAGTGLSFGELSKHLRVNYHIVSLDLPGHGQATKLEKEGDYLPSNLVKHLNKRLQELNITRFYLAGHSWGGHLALYYACTYPEQIKGVMLLDGGYIQNSKLPSTLEEELNGLDEFYDVVRFPSWENFLEQEKSKVTEWTEETEASSRAMVMEHNGEIRLRVTPDITKAVVKGIYAEETREIFEKVNCPALLLISTLPEELKDIRGNASDVFVESVKNAIVKSIPNTTHNFYTEAPKEIAHEMITWLNTIKRGGIYER